MGCLPKGNTMNEWDPRKGQQFGPAWKAVRELLTNEPATWVRVKETARKAGQLKSASARSFVGDLRRHGYITKTTGGLRLTKEGRAAS